MKWTKDKLRRTGRKTKKTMTMYRPFHPLANVDRVFIPTNNCGRAMISVEDCVEIEMQGVPEEVCRKKQSKTTESYSCAMRMNFRRLKNQKRRYRGKK